jgi:hypothetical protein
LVELDECVDKSDCDEDAAEVSVLRVILGGAMSIDTKDRKARTLT